MAERARDLGFKLEGRPGPWNAITDVAGVEVGYTTLIEGEGPLIVGRGPVRTGVTVILPRGKQPYAPVFAGVHVLNGNGEITGLAWMEESGFLETPVAITNTHSVGVVRDALLAWMVDHRFYNALEDGAFWLMPVVSETYDGLLNDINGFHLRPEHVHAALEGASSGPLAEGDVGGGTGMVCYQFKGGTGTSSRRLDAADDGYTVGALVQANYGARRSLNPGGAPLGRQITDLLPELHSMKAAEDRGSIVVVIATDAPLLPHQLKRLARRVPMGIARVGGYASNGSGDIFLAFSTANPGAARREGRIDLEMLPNDRMNPLFEATVQAVEEAILNALAAGQTMQGINGNTVYGLPRERVRALLQVE